MEKFFGLAKNKTNVKTEIIAGITTFMAMAYILMVNPGMFDDLEGVSFGAAYIATAIPAIIGTVLIGLMSNLPLAQAPGMGLNAFFVYTVCMGLGFSFSNALLFVLADGIIFVILTVTGLRKIIFNAIPESVKKAVPAGIGLFIAFLGFQNSGLVTFDITIPPEGEPSAVIDLASFNLLGGATWASIMPMLVTVFSLIAIGVMSKRKVKGAILIGIIGGTLVYYALGFTVDGFYNNFLADASLNPIDAFRAFGTEAFGKVFTKGFDFSGYLSVPGNSTASLVIAFITTALAFCMVDMFDTMGTLYGACRGGNMLIKKADGTTEVPNMNKAMLADALATCTGAVCGTSTVTTFVESSAGVAVGGRTGLSSLVTAALFGVTLFLSPVAALVPAAAYSAALIYVGILMIGCVKDIKWDDPAVALPAFLTLTMMPFTYNISYGIAFGLISHVFVKVFTGKIKEVSIGTWVISILFGAMFFLTH